MKKRFLILAAIVVGLGLTACSVETSGIEEEADKTEKEMNEAADKSEGDVEAAVPGATYQCPDDCENGPSFDVPGPCGSCGKDLVIL
jgi:hypothetical protein